MPEPIDPGLPVFIWTDGACSGNPGPGGYGAVMRRGDGERTVSGSAPMTTNNRMELMAAIAALESLKRPYRVTLTADSEYVVKGMSAWLPKWKTKGWRNGQGKPVVNRDLWERLEAAASRHEMTWQWTRGHAGHPENERADCLARAAIPVP